MSMSQDDARKLARQIAPELAKRSKPMPPKTAGTAGAVPACDALHQWGKPRLVKWLETNAIGSRERGVVLWVKVCSECGVVAVEGSLPPPVDPAAELDAA